ncbi:hypothetical protein CANCADRAFT_32738 [Tortispora caseinolytica NRRL Y-17796]|uniref:AMP-dependent synthetase/ligase domain-containing protein n=1 Tax=Tortispora caseinolytica NRRL Y-17796 TaxID=767744 RepID=A0A1E4TCM0_9ASCO|nr:hypothetical protein CANCADRAFT_32738 [Tortispora caseinolytica NRRL Y-17796]
MTYVAGEVRHALITSGIKKLFAQKPLYANVQEALSMGPADPEEETDRLIVTMKDVIDIDQFLVSAETPGPTVYPIKLTEEEITKKPAYLCFSSGTTGKFKAVMLSQYNIAADVLMSVSIAPFMYSQQTQVMMLPQSHSFGLVMVLMSAPYAGCKVVVMKKFALETYIDFIIKYKATAIMTVPPVLVLLAKHPYVIQKRDEICKTLRAINSGAAPLSKELSDAVKRNLPSTTIVQGYGLTETGPTSHLTKLNRPESKVGKVGFLMANQQARLIDEDLNDVPRGQPGEICIRGPNICLGYYRNPKANAIAFLPGGWFRTGDIGMIDEDNYWSIVDRAKELIKSKGHQVAPAELEDILLSHPDVTDSAVIGIYNEDEATEYPRAFVVLKPGSAAAANPSLICDFIASKVAKHKQLWGGVVVIDTIPKSVSGKILRRQLRERKGDKAFYSANVKAKL